MGTSFRTGFSIPQKKMAAVWAGHIDLLKVNFSLSARVLQRKRYSTTRPKKAVIPPD